MFKLLQFAAIALTFTAQTSAAEVIRLPGAQPQITGQSRLPAQAVVRVPALDIGRIGEQRPEGNAHARPPAPLDVAELGFLGIAGTWQLTEIIGDFGVPIRQVAGGGVTIRTNGELTLRTGCNNLDAQLAVRNNHHALVNLGRAQNVCMGEQGTLERHILSAVSGPFRFDRVPGSQELRIRRNGQVLARFRRA